MALGREGPVHVLPCAPHGVCAATPKLPRWAGPLPSSRAGGSPRGTADFQLPVSGGPRSWVSVHVGISQICHWRCHVHTESFTIHWHISHSAGCLTASASSCHLGLCSPCSGSSASLRCPLPLPHPHPVLLCCMRCRRGQHLCSSATPHGSLSCLDTQEHSGIELVGEEGQHCDLRPPLYS